MLKIKNNKEGVVFVTVIMIIIVMMVLAISAISMNITQMNVLEKEIKSVQSEAIAYGALARMYGIQQTAGADPTLTYSEVLGNTTFTVTADIIDNDSGYDDTDSLNINVGY